MKDVLSVRLPVPSSISAVRSSLCFPRRRPRQPKAIFLNNDSVLLQKKVGMEFICRDIWREGEE